MIGTQPFGRTGHMSTRLIFGGAAFFSVTQAEADRTLDVLLEHGINHIDTAASYGDSELHIGPWMAATARISSSPLRPASAPIRKPATSSIARWKGCGWTAWTSSNCTTW